MMYQSFFFCNRNYSVNAEGKNNNLTFAVAREWISGLDNCTIFPFCNQNKPEEIHWQKKSFHGDIFVEGSIFLMEITNRSLYNLIDIWLAIRSVFSILISSFWNVNKTDQVHSLYQLFSLKIVWRGQFYQTHPLCWRAFLIVSKMSEWIPL